MNIQILKPIRFPKEGEDFGNVILALRRRPHLVGSVDAGNGMAYTKVIQYGYGVYLNLYLITISFWFLWPIGKIKTATK